MSITSKEIAARAGVSQATVSRVINNKPNVRETTRQRVQKVIEELGYYPHAEARGLVTKRTTKIGLIISDILNPFYPELVESIEAFAREKGYAVLLCNTQRDPLKDEVYARLLIEQRVAGVIFSSVTPNSCAPTHFSRAGIPVVFVNRYVKDVRAHTVLTDNFGGAYEMTRHLVELGHSRIAFIRGLPDTTTSQDRESGYRQYLADQGLAIDETLFGQGNYTYRGAYKAARQLLGLSAPPTAIFCANDFMAFGTLDAAYDLKFQVPDHLSVVGFDNIILSSLKAIGLTTVEQPIGEIARKGMEILIDCIEGKNPKKSRRVVYDARLIVRRTSGPVP